MVVSYTRYHIKKKEKNIVKNENTLHILYMYSLYQQEDVENRGPLRKHLLVCCECLIT